MDKYAVVEEPKSHNEKTAGPTNSCPYCGMRLEETSNVSKCPRCGTRPFEKRPDPKK